MFHWHTGEADLRIWNFTTGLDGVVQQIGQNPAEVAVFHKTVFFQMNAVNQGDAGLLHLPVFHKNQDVYDTVPAIRYSPQMFQLFRKRL